MKKETIIDIKELMEYKDGSEICRNCISYKGPDISGNANAKGERCTFHKLDIPVDSTGHCKNFDREPTTT